MRVDRPLAAFFAGAFAIAYGSAWGLSAIAASSGFDSWSELNDLAEVWGLAPYADQLVVPRALVYALSRAADFAFSIAGVVAIAATAGVSGLRELGARLVRFRVSWRGYAFALGLPLGLYALSVVVTALGDPAIAASATFSPTLVWTLLLSPHAGLLFYALTRGGLGEELGLRGFALPRLLDRHAPLRASLWLGLFWGLWHLPILIGRPPVAVIAFLLATLAYSVVFTWLFLRTRRSLVPVILLHAANNSFDDAFEAVFPALVDVGWETPFVVGVLLTGIAVAIALRRST
ncbi:MAG: CPBP family intramembrane metalloprotease [Deltaproteobacteria bacterium]|nr:CPBP family intramembrane metalloprotease [Deltaproteobacteria bacterium]